MYLYTDNQPLSAFDPQETDIWLEGRSRKNISFHQKISIGDPNGVYVSYSWGFSRFPDYGNSYIDLRHSHPNYYDEGQILAYKITTNQALEDKFKAFMDAKLGHEEGLYGITDTCRTWSQRIFEMAPRLERTSLDRPYAPGDIGVVSKDNTLLENTTAFIQTIVFPFSTTTTGSNSSTSK